MERDLLKDGTRVIMHDGRVGTIQGNDWNENCDWGFENVNYYVCPLSGGNDYEMYLAKDLIFAEDKKLLVCEHCLMAIESREGNQATLRHYVNEENELESKCDWCGESGFDTLYELV